jgi:acetyltransferase-like isoleucine patch superfamily enzyme
MLIKRKKIPVFKMLSVGLFPSFLKKIIYRMKGYNIGKNVTIGLGSVIIGKEVAIENNTKIGFVSVIRARKIQIGRFVQIGSLVMIDTEKIEIGEDTRINENVIIAGIKTPESLIKIGKRAIIMEYSFINPTKPIIIGDDTGIGGHCLLFTHGSWLSQLDGFPVTFAPITLGNNVWLPWRVFIMPGVSVGDNVVIGANSLLSKNIPSNCLAAGSPAKIIKEEYPPSLEEEERMKIIENMLSEFENYLKYFNFDVKISQTDNNSFFLKVANNKVKSLLIFLQKKCESLKKCMDDSLIILDFEDDIKEYTDMSKMVINFRTKQRIGSTLIGEEFVKFISRYGVRFNRLD